MSASFLLLRNSFPSSSGHQNANECGCGKACCFSYDAQTCCLVILPVTAAFVFFIWLFFQANKLPKIFLNCVHFLERTFGCWPGFGPTFCHRFSGHSCLSYGRRIEAMLATFPLLFLAKNKKWREWHGWRRLWK
jgi:hypothetical protein